MNRFLSVLSMIFVSTHTKKWYIVEGNEWHLLLMLALVFYEIFQLTPAGQTMAGDKDDHSAGSCLLLPLLSPSSGPPSLTAWPSLSIRVLVSDWGCVFCSNIPYWTPLCIVLLIPTMHSAVLDIELHYVLCYWSPPCALLYWMLYIVS